MVQVQSGGAYKVDEILRSVGLYEEPEAEKVTKSANEIGEEWIEWHRKM